MKYILIDIRSVESSSSIQASIFANGSCDALTPRDTPCLLGNYVQYAVKVTGPEDIATTIRFADAKNIRLVIRNTAHDYMGRSTGAGGLAIWTHHLKNIEIKDWSDNEHKGKAIKIGAGVEGHEVIEAAKAAGLVVVTGECPTVGVAGGFTQAGGHSPLSGEFGLSADNTLEFEVVTANGQFVCASPSSKYSDLFWALSGGGAGNYGVVVSVTLKAHPDAMIGGASFDIAQPGLNYTAIIDAWHVTLVHVTEARMQATYSSVSEDFTVLSITGYNKKQADFEKVLEPFIKFMATMNYTLKPTYTSFNSYSDHFLHYYGPLPAGAFGGAGDKLMGGRLLLRDALPNVGGAINKTMSHGIRFIGQAQNVTRFAAPEKRALLPQWRKAVTMSAYIVPLAEDETFASMKTKQNFITNTIMPIIERVTPNAGAYINEADFQQKDWQTVFFGDNYPRLLATKKKYDSKGIFYNQIAVGSEGWKIQADGRMCKA